MEPARNRCQRSRPQSGKPGDRPFFAAIPPGPSALWWPMCPWRFLMLLSPLRRSKTTAAWHGRLLPPRCKRPSQPAPTTCLLRANPHRSRISTSCIRGPNPHLERRAPDERRCLSALWTSQRAGGTLQLRASVAMSKDTLHGIGRTGDLRRLPSCGRLGSRKIDPWPVGARIGGCNCCHIDDPTHGR